MRLLALLALATAISASTVQLFPRADVGDPCEKERNCYGGAKCCPVKPDKPDGDKVCKLGACDTAANPGAKCQNIGYCFGGANCCSGTCKLGSCRMNGTCDEDDDCYGWCHNQKGKCDIPTGKEEGKCKCPQTIGS